MQQLDGHPEVTSWLENTTFSSTVESDSPVRVSAPCTCHSESSVGSLVALLWSRWFKKLCIIKQRNEMDLGSRSFSLSEPASARCETWPTQPSTP